MCSTVCSVYIQSTRNKCRAEIQQRNEQRPPVHHLCILFEGGTISNMYSILVARYHFYPEVKTRGMGALPQLVLFTSEHVTTTHTSTTTQLLHTAGLMESVDWVRIWPVGIWAQFCVTLRYTHTHTHTHTHSPFSEGMAFVNTCCSVTADIKSLFRKHSANPLHQSCVFHCKRFLIVRDYSVTSHLSLEKSPNFFTHTKVLINTHN